jgi:Spy/CpxP family protein refolding chaperone
LKKGWVWVALLLSLGVNIGVLVTIGMSRARPQAPIDHPRQPGDMRPAERLARHLQLDGSQRERFMEIQQRLFQTVRGNREELVGLRSELRREVMSEAPDPHEVDRLLLRVGEIHMDLDRAMVESVLATRKLLDPEQQERYFEVLERIQRASEWGGRGDRGRPRRPERRPPPPDRP